MLPHVKALNRQEERRLLGEGEVKRGFQSNKIAVCYAFKGIRYVYSGPKSLSCNSSGLTLEWVLPCSFATDQYEWGLEEPNSMTHLTTYEMRVNRT